MALNYRERRSHSANSDREEREVAEEFVIRGPSLMVLGVLAKKPKRKSKDAGFSLARK